MLLIIAIVVIVMKEDFEKFVSAVIKTECISPNDELSSIFDEFKQHELYEDDLFYITAAKKDYYGLFKMLTEN